jgi:hypothetical protein
VRNFWVIYGSCYFECYKSDAVQMETGVKMFNLCFLHDNVYD